MLTKVIVTRVFLWTLLLSGTVFAQTDSSAKQWFQSYYSTKYLNEVLKKKQFNYEPPNGVVPDSETAIDLAVVFLSKIYGKETIQQEKPFNAVFRDGYWVVYGSLPRGYQVGGVAVIVIKKKNGEIINISHDK